MTAEIRYPEGEKQEICAICSGPLDQIASTMTSAYPNLVCWQCDLRAVTTAGTSVTSADFRSHRRTAVSPSDSDSFDSDTAPNPVFIDGQKCWRRYKLGGYITRLDQFDCADIYEFREKHES